MLVGGPAFNTADVAFGQDDTKRADVYMYPSKLTTNDKLNDGESREAVEIKSDTALIWVDRMPGARFVHPTQYVLISKEGTRILQGHWSPVLNGKALFRDSTTTKIKNSYEIG